MQALEKTTDTDIEAELNILPSISIEKLRVRWRGIFGKEPPRAFGPDLLRRSIAYRLQEQAVGRLNDSDRRELDRLIRGVSKTSSGRIELPRRIKAGAVLIREWKGKTYRVTVVDGGFIYDEVKYASLSEIARIITSARWNGPRFFGLRKSAPVHKPKLKTSTTEARTGAT
jgi:DUF2924 family protein